jgi:hypothetical protein
MRAFKNHVRRQTAFNEYGVFKDIHIPLLVFQPDALRHVKRRFRLTRVDFLVLSAGFTVQKNTFCGEFTSPQLIETLRGVGSNLVYKSLNHLMKLGLIRLEKAKKSNRRFLITEQGIACIQSFVQHYNSNISAYGWIGKPECLR